MQGRRASCRWPVEQPDTSWDKKGGGGPGCWLRGPARRQRPQPGANAAALFGRVLNGGPRCGPGGLETGLASRAAPSVVWPGCRSCGKAPRGGACQIFRSGRTRFPVARRPSFGDFLSFPDFRNEGPIRRIRCAGPLRPFDGPGDKSVGAMAVPEQAFHLSPPREDGAFRRRPHGALRTGSPGCQGRWPRCAGIASRAWIVRPLRRSSGRPDPVVSRRH